MHKAITIIILSLDDGDTMPEAGKHTNKISALLFCANVSCFMYKHRVAIELVKQPSKHPPGKHALLRLESKMEQLKKSPADANISQFRDEITQYQYYQ